MIITGVEPRIRLLIVDDHTVIREGLTLLLSDRLRQGRPGLFRRRDSVDRRRRRRRLRRQLLGAGRDFRARAPPQPACQIASVRRVGVIRGRLRDRIVWIDLAVLKAVRQKGNEAMRPEPGLEAVKRLSHLASGPTASLPHCLIALLPHCLAPPLPTSSPVPAYGAPQSASRQLPRPFRVV